MIDISDEYIKAIVDSAKSRCNVDGLKLSMTECGVGIKELAYVCGVNNRTVYRWLEGITPVPLYVLVVLQMLMPMP